VSHRRTASLLAAVSLAGSWLLVPALSSAATPATCHGHRATIVGTPHHDVLQGTASRDVIAGLGGNDEITGGGGRDLICGGTGVDEITLGDASEEVWGGHGTDDFIGGTGADVLHGDRGWDEFRDAGGPGTVEYGGIGRDDFSSGVRVRIWGGPGRDSAELTACTGCVVHGGHGSDSVQVVGGENLTIGGGPGNDGISATTSVRTDIVLDGGVGADEALLLLTRPSDVPVYQRLLLDLGPGWLHADATRMRVAGFDDAERFGTSSTDELTLSYTVLGTAARNRLAAGQGDGFNSPVKLVGRGGGDNLHGGDGDDLIEGGPGHDRADARFGDDTCVSVEIARHCEQIQD
jgi:Ca2+-binding RTX toxin-like protein